MKARKGTAALRRRCSARGGLTKGREKCKIGNLMELDDVSAGSFRYGGNGAK